jgi:hypothetical protein
MTPSTLYTLFAIWTAIGLVALWLAHGRRR